MCLDWRVLVGLAAVGVGIYVVAPGTVVAALPILSLAACPLSMLLMKVIRESPGEDGGSRATDDGPTREEQLARMRAAGDPIQPNRRVRAGRGVKNDDERQNADSGLVRLPDPSPLRAGYTPLFHRSFTASSHVAATIHRECLCAPGVSAPECE